MNRCPVNLNTASNHSRYWAIARGAAVVLLAAGCATGEAYSGEGDVTLPAEAAVYRDSSLETECGELDRGFRGIPEGQEPQDNPTAYEWKRRSLPLTDRECPGVLYVWMAA